MNKSDKTHFSLRLYEQLSRLTKALSSPRRLELIDLLAQRERSVDELARLAGMSVANTSRHLQALRGARLVTVRRDGLYAHYRLADESVFALWQAVRDLGERRLSSMRELVETHFTGRRMVEPVRMDELLERIRSGGVALVDARPEGEFLAGHIAGAVNVPVEELEARLHVLPMEQEVIVYCRGPYSDLSDQAVAALRASGYRARRFALGFPDWRAAGHPTEGVSSS